MTFLLVPFYSVSTQVILQEMEWSDHCFGLWNFKYLLPRRTLCETECDTLRLTIAYASINSSGAHPPGNRGAFAYVVSPGGWALAYPGATLSVRD